MQKPKILNVLVLTVLMLSMTINVQPSDALVSAEPRAEEYVFRRSWGGEGDQFSLPNSLAVGLDEKLYVAQNGQHHITIFNPPDRTFQIWGSLGSEEGKFNDPRGVFIDEFGYIFVADTSNNRIQVFDSKHEFILSLGNTGESSQQLKYPRAVATDKNGNIYVSGHHGIHKYDRSGNLLLSWGGQDSGDIQLSFPGGIAIDQSNFIYVADTYNHRIVKFDTNGLFLLAWGNKGLDEVEFQYPHDLVIDNIGNVIVTDFSTGRVAKYTSDGEFIDDWYGFRGASGIAIDKLNNLYVADMYNSQIKKFTNSGQLLVVYDGQRSAVPKFYYPMSIGIDDKDQLFITTIENLNEILFRFSLDGEFHTSWGRSGRNVIYLMAPLGITADRHGNLYVSEQNNGVVMKFNHDGNLLDTWGELGKEPGLLSTPSGIGINSNDIVYVVDTGNKRIVIFSNEGDIIDIWGGIGDELIQFTFPTGLAIDQIDQLYIIDRGNIQIIDQNGDYVDSLKLPDDFGYSRGIAVDQNGMIFITDTTNNNLLIIDTQGNIVQSLGSHGSGPGQFNKPNAIAIDENNYIYVTEELNNRIQVFSPGFPSIDQTSGLVQNGTFEAYPALTEWNHGGSLRVARTNHAAQGDFALQLGNPVSQINQGQGDAWAHTTFYVRPEWDRPILSFQYNMFVNDIMDYSDFFVAIQDGVGLNHLETLLRDGYQPCIPGTAPAAGTDLGWRTASFDLSAYKGEHIRLVFSNRNLWPISWGIWTYVDDVRVIDAGPLPTIEDPFISYLPMLSYAYCDPVPNRGRDADSDALIRPDLP